MIKNTVLVSLLLFSFCACHQQQPINQKEIEANIMSVLHEQEQAWNAGDLKQYMNGYWQADSLRFASGGHINYGWQTTLESYQKGYPDKKAMGILSFSGIDIQILSDDAALVFGTWRLKRETDEPWGLFSLIFRKTAEGWRIVHDHTSSAKAAV